LIFPVMSHGVDEKQPKFPAAKKKMVNGR